MAKVRIRWKRIAPTRRLFDTKPLRERETCMSTAVISERIPQPVETSQEFEYPGLPTTCDGAEAVVHVEIHVAQAAGAYPITSSTTMGGGFNEAVMNGMTNLWGD